MIYLVTSQAAVRPALNSFSAWPPRIKSAESEVRAQLGIPRRIHNKRVGGGDGASHTTQTFKPFFKRKYQYFQVKKKPV